MECLPGSCRVVQHQEQDCSRQSKTACVEYTKGCALLSDLLASPAHADPTWHRR